MTALSCRPLTLAQVRSLPPFPSVYTTDRVYRLEAVQGSREWTWTLREDRLAYTVQKVYDEGNVDDWLASYEDGTPPSQIRFTGAFNGSDCLGIATWKRVEWNNTIWLMDIRVRADRKRAGVGTALVHSLAAEARSSGARGILVETQTTNAPAVDFYRHLGFRIAGFNDHLYTNHDRHSGDIALYLFLSFADGVAY